VSLDAESLSQNPHPDYAESIPAHNPWVVPPPTRWAEPAPHEHCDGYTRHGQICCSCGEHSDKSGSLTP